MSNDGVPTFPLAGVRVLDFTKLLAGPICTQYLSDMGAEVIKVEDRLRGDDARSTRPFAGGEGAVFLSVNRNKRSIALDLKHPGSREIVHKLAQQADVLVESFGTGVAERLGLGRDEIRKVNPSLIYCSVSAYGRTGPAAMLPGYELVSQAASGMMMISGEVGGSPIRTAFSPLDQTTGIHAATSIIAALYTREKTGQARFVEASLFETAAAFMAMHAQDYWLTGELPQRPGSGIPSMCPYQAFEVKDASIVLAIGNDGLWRKFCNAVGLEHLIDAPRFATNAARVENRQETVDVVAQVLLTRSAAEWIDVLGRAGVPCAPIETVDQLYEHPQTHARGMVMDYTHPQAGPMKAVAYPGSIEGMPRAVRRPPPQHGEHTDEILRELGLTADAISSLRASEVAGKK